MAKILIVDDASFVRIVLRKYFEKLGHEVVAEAITAEEAVILYKELRPEIVTMDIVLQGNDNGLSALQDIMVFDSCAKVIMISAHGHVGVVEEAMAIGAKGFVDKPADGNVLKEMIDKVLNTSSKRASLHL